MLASASSPVLAHAPLLRKSCPPLPRLAFPPEGERQKGPRSGAKSSGEYSSRLGDGVVPEDRHLPQFGKTGTGPPCPRARTTEEGDPTSPSQGTGGCHMPVPLEGLPDPAGLGRTPSPLGAECALPPEEAGDHPKLPRPLGERDGVRGDSGHPGIPSPTRHLDGQRRPPRMQGRCAKVAHWWEQAEEDLDTARHNAEGGKYYAAAFFCHPAAEKALKALPKAQSSEPTLFTPSVPSSALRHTPELPPPAHRRVRSVPVPQRHRRDPREALRP